MSWKAFLAGILVAVAAIALGAYLYFRLGCAPVATSAAPMPFESRLAHIGMHARIEKEAPHNDPVPVTAENEMAGADLYRKHCAMCHGLPAQPRPADAMGMFPHPPQLFAGKGVTDDPAGETFWKIQNGIRLSGMPSFDKVMTTVEMWQVADLLANAKQLPQPVTARLQAAQ
jgi:thiosulfate dehydrogenase